MTDPLAALRVPEDEMRAIDPWTRARLRMEAGEQAEEAARRDSSASRREQFEDQCRVAEMNDRIELAQQGFLSREAQAMHARAEAERAGRVAELRQELERLTGQESLGRLPSAADVELAQHRKGQAEWNGGSCRRMRELSLIDAGGLGDQGPPLRRTGPAPEPRPLRELTVPPMLQRFGAPPRLSDGDW